MPYVITGTCTKDEHCIETCPANCIHPTKDEPDFATAAQLYVNPTECIDCVVRATRVFQSGGIAGGTAGICSKESRLL